MTKPLPSLRTVARLAVLAACAAALLAACGGGGSDTLPRPSISAPASGSTFRAGDTLNFSGSATDALGGTLSGAALSWWVDLHHDAHTHPMRLPSAGGSGTVVIPTRGETSDNIFYRFHLSATDGAGQTAQVFRDVLPLKARVTLATAPAGLQLSLDGQALSGPSSFTGVVGLERDIAAAEQNFAGRRYRFGSWSQGGTASQTISTPASDTTYTASFADVGPATNQPPVVSLSAPATVTVGAAVQLSASASDSDSDGSVARVHFFDGARCWAKTPPRPLH